MVNDCSLLYDKKNLNFEKKVIVANKSELPVKCIGSMKIKICERDFIVKNLEYVPDLCANLLSVRKMVESGKKVIFEKDRCIIAENNGKIVATAKLFNDLYHIDCTASRTNAFMANDKFEIWHRRLGHICNKSLVDVKNANVVVHYGKISKEPCVTCVKGKQNPES